MLAVTIKTHPSNHTSIIAACLFFNFSADKNKRMQKSCRSHVCNYISELWLNFILHLLGRFIFYYLKSPISSLQYLQILPMNSITTDYPPQMFKLTDWKWDWNKIVLSVNMACWDILSAQTYLVKGLSLQWHLCRMKRAFYVLLPRECNSSH